MLRSNIETLKDSDPTFSTFWTNIPPVELSEDKILETAWKLAKFLSVGNSELCVPLLIHAACVPNRQNRNRALWKSISLLACQTLQQKSGALQAYYGSLTEPKRSEEEQIRIYDFHSCSYRRPVPDESADAAATSRCLKWLSDNLHDAQERRVSQQRNITVFCHLLSTMAGPLICKLFAAADQGREENMSGTIFFDERAVRLRETFIRLKTAFAAHSISAQSPLSWLTNQLEKTKAQIQKQPGVSRSRP